MIPNLFAFSDRAFPESPAGQRVFNKYLLGSLGWILLGKGTPDRTILAGKGL